MTTLPLRLTLQVRIALLQSLVLAAPPLVWAGPQGERVVAGEGNISRPDTSTTIVQQQSARLALDWQSFDVARHELVEFKQPSVTAEALNRIFDQRGSEIFGHIKANGRVLLMNPNGVLFGPGARVNVNGLVAAGLQIDVADFMRGRYTLSGNKGASGIVVNRGLIAAATGGDIALLGKQVRNEGVIVADAGRVELLAGDTVAVDFDGDGLLRFAVVDGVLENPSGAGSAVINTGTLVADGGTVVMAAKTAREVFSQAVNNTGVIRAGRIANQGGQIKLVGVGPDATVIHSGRLDASARDQGDGGSVLIDADGKTIVARGAVVAARGGERGSGGDIQITGREVNVAASEVDASGDSGGGQILVGGDARGANPRVRNALTTTIDAGAALKANAEIAGDGGKVVVWADDTHFAGQIEAKGGVVSGNGGLAELSGKRQIVLAGHADLRALRGAFGHLLIDPGSVTIQDGPDDASNEGPNTFNDAFVAAQLELGDLTINTDNATNALAPTITIDGDVDITWIATTLFELVAGSDVSIGGIISNPNGSMRIDFGQDDVDSTLAFTAASITLDQLDVNGAAGDDTIDLGTATITLAASSIKGGDGADTFDFSAVTWSNSGNTDVDGGAGANTLLGATVDNAFSIDTADQGTFTFSGQTIDFSSIANLTGGAGADAFVFADGASLSGTIDGGAGSDTLSFASVATARTITLNNTGTTDGFRGAETLINAGATNGFDNIDVLTGSAATDTLNGLGGAATWDLGVTKQYTNANTLTFDAIENLQGGNGADTFNVSQDHTGDLLGGNSNDNFIFIGSAVLTGAVRGEAGGNDSVSFTGYGSVVSVLDQGSDGKGDVTGTPDPIVTAPDDFIGIEAITGVGGVAAPNGQDNTWVITGIDAFSLNGIGYTNIDVAIGGDQIDTFTIQSGGRLTGATAINGGAGNDVLATVAAGTFTLSGNSAGSLTTAGLTTTFVSVEDLLGGSNADNFIFTGAFSVRALDGGAGSDALDWSASGGARNVAITALNAAGADGSDASITTGFNNIESLRALAGSSLTGPNAGSTWTIGGVDNNSDDGTLVSGGGSVTFIDFATVIGGSSTDAFTFTSGALTGSLIGGSGTDTVTARNAANTWTLTAANQGNVTGLGGTFSQIENLIGGSSTDSFQMIGGTLSGTLAGRAGSDTLTANNVVNAWAITGAGVGTVTGIGGGFSQLENLIGGSSTDTLTGNNVATIWQLTAANTGTVTGLTGTFAQMENLVGGSSTDSFSLNGGTLSGTLAGGGGSDTLSGDNLANTWTINTANGGNVTGITGAFSSIENLTGNAQNDTFAFVGIGTISGAIVGGAQAIEDLFDFSVATGPVTVDGATLNGIERLIGSGGSDILIGTGGGDTFNVAAANAGDLNGVSFSSFENLLGAGGADSFLFAAAGSVTGAISGGSGSDVLNLSARASTTASLSANSANGYDGSASGTGGFSGIETIIASSAGVADSLSGMNTATIWGLDATPQYTDSSSARTLDFAGFEMLTGGAQADTFNVSVATPAVLDGGDGADIFSLSGGSASGITGGNGTDEIRGPTSNTQFSLTGGGTGAVAGGASVNFTQIENLTGNTGVDTFTVTGSHNGDLSGAAGADIFQLADALNGAIDGGANDDTLAFAGGSLSGTFAGGSGIDTIDYSGTGAAVSVDLGVNSAPLMNSGAASGFNSVEQLIGSFASDTLIGTGAADTFTVTGLNAGAITGVLVQFTSFERLHGGAGDDRFDFDDGARVDAVDGGTAITRDVLDLSAYTSDLTWTFAVSNSLAFGMDFADVEAFLSGAGNDAYVVQNGGSLVLFGATPQVIDGGAGFNTVSYAATASAVTVELSTLVNIAALTASSSNADRVIGTSGADQFETSGANQGCLPNCAVPTLIYASFENLDGGDGADRFVIRHAVSGAAEGGAGNDTFVILDTATGDLDGGADNDTFDLGDAVTSVVLNADLIGGAGDDTFRFFQNSRLVGGIQGGLGLDTIDLTGSAMVQDIETIAVGTSGSGVIGTITNAAPPAGDLLSGTYDNIDDIQGNASTLSTLVGNLTSDNTWVVSGNNSGTLNGVSFSNFKLLGGTAIDTFTFTNVGRISNGIDGGAGGVDVVAGAAAGSLFVMTGDTSGSLDPDIAGGTASTAFTRIDQLLGGIGNDAFEITGTFDGSIDGAAGTDTLTGEDTTNTWTITGSAAGVVTGLAGGFSSIESLAGGVVADTFTMSGTNFVGQIAGNGGVDELHGDDVVNTWNLSGANSGNLGGVAVFSTIENLVGGAAADAFVFSNAAQFERLDGALGVDVLDYSATGGAVTINLLTSQVSLVNDQALNLEQVIGSTGSADTLVGDDSSNTWTIAGSNLGNVDGFAFSGIENLMGGAGSDQFRLASAVGVAAGSIDGGLGTDHISNQGVTNSWNITGVGAGTVNNNAFTNIENLTALNANATLSFGGNGSITGTYTADTVTLTTSVNTANTNFVVDGDLNSNATRAIDTGNGRFAVSGAVTSAGGFSVTTANAAITIGGALNTDGATSLETGSGAITVSAAIDTGGNALNVDGDTIDVAGPVQAGAVTIVGDATLRRALTTSGAQTYAGSQRFFGDLTGASLRFSGSTNFAGNVLLEASGNLVDFNGTVGGTGNLTINPTLDTEIVFDGSDGPGHLAAAGFHNFAGHLIVGGRLDPSDPPAENAAVLEINAKRISILQDLITNGDVTLLASNIDLLANLGANLDTGQVTLLAVGDTQGFGEPEGDITGPESGLVTVTGARAVLIANNNIPNNENIALDLGGGSVLVAVASSQDQPSFDPSSNAVSESFDPNALVLISSLTNPIGVQAVQVIFTNPAAALTGLQNVQFIDLGVFEQELSLFGVIGKGIALSLDQCEELEGCGPNVSEADLVNLIATLEGRIAGLEQRQGGELGHEAARLLQAYRTELANYQGYQRQLQEYQEAEESVSEDFEELEGEDFEATPQPEVPVESPEESPETPAKAPAEVLDEDFEELDDFNLAPERAPGAPAEFEELDEGIEPVPANDPFLDPAPEFGPPENLDEFEELEEELGAMERPSRRLAMTRVGRMSPKGVIRRMLADNAAPPLIRPMGY